MNIIEMRGKRAILVDDIIDTAGTKVHQTINGYRCEGSICMLSWCIIRPAIERIQKSAIKELVTLNTILLLRKENR